jgi:hypothetical protein
MAYFVNYLSIFLKDLEGIMQPRISSFPSSLDFEGE